VLLYCVFLMREVREIIEYLGGHVCLHVSAPKLLDRNRLNLILDV
jgi:hypothetical protein